MSLDLRNFVEVNINYNKIQNSSVPTGIVTLITTNTDYSADPYKDDEGERIIFKSLAEYEKTKSDKLISDTSLDDYVKCFFINKGKALQIIGGRSTDPVVTFMIKVLRSLNYRNVLVVSDCSEEEMRQVIEKTLTEKTDVAENPLRDGDPEQVATFSGLNEKFFISSTTDVSSKLFNHISDDTTPAFPSPNNKYYDYDGTTGQYQLLATQPADWASNYASYFEVAQSSTYQFDNYMIKVGNKGIEMAAAAYFSKVNVSISESINDYAFTTEKLKSEDFDFSESIIKENATGVKLIASHFNFDTELVNEIRNYPGDCLSGADAMNYYVKILITQDLTETIMRLLVSKIKFNQSGINRLDNAISQQMITYIENGYLNTDYIWTGEDLYYKFHDIEYLVCSRNTPLTKGYRCVILPLTSLTSAEKEAHVLPPVYILLASQTGIRQIVISGDVY